MNSGQFFATFVVPAVVLLVAYVAMRLNEWDVNRHRRKPPGP